MSAKDTRLTFRVRSDLKKKLESVAASEGRSVSQICEAFLRGALVIYQKEGTKCVRRFLSREESEP
jgi:predicted transcriptional regulator